MCKPNSDETGDVDFLPWCTAYFGLTVGRASIVNRANLSLQEMLVNQNFISEELITLEFLKELVKLFIGLLCSFL